MDFEKQEEIVVSNQLIVSIIRVLMQQTGFSTITKAQLPTNLKSILHWKTIIQLFNYSIIQLFNYSIIRLFNYSIIQLFNYSIIQLSNYSIILIPFFLLEKKG